MRKTIGLALGYLLLPNGADAESLTNEATETFAGYARRHGYVVVATLTDTAGRTDQGFYELLGDLRLGRTSAVVVACLDHLTHHPCLNDADERTITRYLRARVLRLDADASRRRARHRDALQTQPMPFARTRPPPPWAWASPQTRSPSPSFRALPATPPRKRPGNPGREHRSTATSTT
jgi:hypothetical protein